jgi:hypothetical protein
MLRGTGEPPGSVKHSATASPSSGEGTRRGAWQQAHRPSGGDDAVHLVLDGVEHQPGLGHLLDARDQGNGSGPDLGNVQQRDANQLSRDALDG